jgi:multidrug resistance efflux pump
MRWLVFRAICSGLVLILFLAGCERGATPPSTPVTSIMDETAQSAVEAGRLSVLGTILPAQRVKLSFLVGGPLHATHVQVGSEVKAGELLAALDTTDLEFTVQEAEDALVVSQALLNQAQAGPREEAVAVAEAEFQRAQSQYEKTEALLERALTQTYPQEVAIAQADYQGALARYEQVKAGPSPEELAAARAQVQKAESALQRAQAAYDRVAGRPDVGASPEAAALQEATIDYELAKAQYERLQRSPTQAELREAQAQVSRAEAQLRLVQIGPGDAELATGASNIAVAQAQLALAQAAPQTEDVALAEARVQQARTALERANLALAHAELRAPFDGTVSAVYLHAGEWAAPGAAVVELLDTTRWQVETRNIGELNIGRVAVGQEAVVRVIAFRDGELRGRVAAISPIAVVQQGDTTYTVFIDLEPTDLNLRPGMNVEVEILTE